MWSAVLYLVVLSGVYAKQLESRLLQTTQGPVRGYKDQDEDIFVFRSIPYATAPTGEHRFRAALPAPTWNEPLEAVDTNIICPQFNYILQMFKNKIMQEDCLIANIYVPKTQNRNLPVYVYVHGGGYTFGFGDLITPKKLVASQKIIAITFNYRLGPHGFLCLGTEDAPGNAGMKDQIALLRWVKKNIASFGGNPDDVTIGGGSAGSSAVDLIMLSKMSDGLFNKVIPESGANTAAFSLQSNPVTNAKEYAKGLKFNDTDNFYELEKFYKSTPYKDLFSDSINALDRTDSSFLMTPCVERQTKEEAFLVDSAVSILKNGKYKKLPMLYGIAQMEGLYRLQKFDTWKNTMNENFADFLPSDLEFESENQKKEVASKVKNFYFSDKQIDETSILAYINYFTDTVFGYSTLRSVKLQVEAGNNQIYLYEYSYTDDITPLIPHTNIRGANHCAQSMAVMDDFNTAINKAITSEDYEMFRNTIRAVWINFIVTGKPIMKDIDLPAWPPVGSNWSPHMNINKKFELRGSLLQNRTLFWEEIYKKHYRMPQPPPKLPKYNPEL